MAIVKRFGENRPDQWYELPTGERVPCDEITIQKLWCDWVVREDSERADDDKYHIFEFGSPVEIDFQTAEYW